MPVREFRSDLLLLPAGTTVGEALAKLPADVVTSGTGQTTRDRTQRAYSYVVVPRPDGQFLLARWFEIEMIAAIVNTDLRALALANVPDLLTGRDLDALTIRGPKGLTARDLIQLLAPVAGLDRDTHTQDDAKRARDAHPGQRLVITAGGAAVGILVVERLAAASLGDDPFARSTGSAVLGISDDEDERDAMRGSEPESMLLGDAPPPPTEDKRVINGWIEGYTRSAPDAEPEWLTLGTDQPLLVGQTYEVKFDVDLKRASALITSGGVAGLAAKAREQQIEVFEILVEIAVEEQQFALYSRSDATLYVPAAATPSKNRVSFTVEPLLATGTQDGSATITVLLYAFNELFQKLTLTVAVTRDRQKAFSGAQKNAIRTQASGIPLAHALASTPRRAANERVNLVIIRQTTGYEFILQGAVVKRAAIKVEPETLNDWLKNVRKTFFDEVVNRKTGEIFPYQQISTTIDKATYDATLIALAKLGKELFEQLFYFQENREDAHAMAALIREASQQGSLSVSVVADRFVLPWSLIYDREETEPVDPDGFWGFKHLVQYMPEFAAATPVGFGSQLRAKDRLSMAFAFDATIDTQFNTNVIASQRAALAGEPQLAVQEIDTKKGFLAMLKGTDAPPFIYIYSHANSASTGEALTTERAAGGSVLKTAPIAGTGASYISVGGERLTLKEMMSEASLARPKFANAPLVFLNACQGAELTALQYDGLLPFLMGRGARGAIGTEVDTPVYFAAEFAKTFIAEFAKGEETLGEIFLRMRRRYRDEHNNVMGLVYALYTSGDLRVVYES